EVARVETGGGADGADRRARVALRAEQLQARLHQPRPASRAAVGRAHAAVQAGLIGSRLRHRRLLAGHERRGDDRGAGTPRARRHREGNAVHGAGRPPLRLRPQRGYAVLQICRPALRGGGRRHRGKGEVMTRKLVGALAAAIALLVPAAAQAHTPILFVHGWSESSSLWTTMIGRFEKDGWGKAELTNWTYNTSQSNATTAKEVATKVSEIKTKTGATKVDLITHSMGALSTRYYIKNLGGESTIESWVSLGGPNHGTTTANFC